MTVVKQTPSNDCVHFPQVGDAGDRCVTACGYASLRDHVCDVTRMSLCPGGVVDTDSPGAHTDTPFAHVAACASSVYVGCGVAMSFDIGAASDDTPIGYSVACAGYSKFQNV